MKAVYLGIVLFPLLGAVLAGLLPRPLGRAGAHWVTILGVGASFGLSLVVLKHLVIDGAAPFNGPVYTWLGVEGIRLEVGFLVDTLTALMITTVTLVSLLVHIYTIGYMRDDPGYQRFFCYTALFTFAMLMLVMANNFLQLFFGWEAVGLVSYLLIGFWYQRPSANVAAMKAFLVNRVGDLGLLLGIALVLMYFNSLDYADVFAAAPLMAQLNIELLPGVSWSLLTVIGILLFIGAMGKSAQAPLHVWLPDSMEGPTPISALIHAATMVTAGIFMVARMSPLFTQSPTALSVVLVIGAITALFMGLLGLVQHDIKRVIAYSTLSQLGYMVVALGAAAYSAAIFHLMTHAFFKALLFLSAGSVIIALHHEQDIRRMGGLYRYLPITGFTFLIGTLALIGTPGLSGFYSKDIIIEAVAASTTPGAGFAYLCVLLGVFVTALYSFRLYFLVFHGPERLDHHTRQHLQESPAVVTVPLILLAIPAVILGYVTVGPLVFGDFFQGALVPGGLPAEVFPGPAAFAGHGLLGLPFWLAVAGVATAWYGYLYRPDQAERWRQRFGGLYRLLVRQYGFDECYQAVFAAGTRRLGAGLWKYSDLGLIDGLVVDGTARLVGWFAAVTRTLQSGYLYHYAFAMILGLLGLLTWVLTR